MAVTLLPAQSMCMSQALLSHFKQHSVFHRMGIPLVCGGGHYPKKIPQTAESEGNI